VLCFRAISSASARATHYNKPNTFEEAVAARDALACAIHERMFSYLVEIVNKAMHTDQEGHSISILGWFIVVSSKMFVLIEFDFFVDIFGFECFDENGFSQLASK